MTIIEKVKNFLAKLQSLPEDKKKIILWTIVAILAVIMGYFWVCGTIDKFSKVGLTGKNNEMPGLDESSAPSLDILDNSETADWRVYKNSKYGFEVNYPKDWLLREYGTGVAFSPADSGSEAINVGFYERGANYCQIPFDDYIRIAGPAEIQNYTSLNIIDGGISYNGVEMYQARWNYTDSQGVGQISLPITYIEINEELCGSIEAFLNDNNYSDVYNKIILTFNLIK